MAQLLRINHKQSESDPFLPQQMEKATYLHFVLQAKAAPARWHQHNLTAFTYRIRKIISPFFPNRNNLQHAIYYCHSRNKTEYYIDQVNQNEGENLPGLENSLKAHCYV